MVPFVVVGGLAGLVWAAGFRSWMVQLVGDDSTFSWMTFTLLLLPGTAVGALLGWAAHGRPGRTRTARWLALSPLLLSSALLDPTIFEQLITSGIGSGSLMVVATALAGGFVLGRRRWSVLRVAAAVVAVLGLLLLTFIGTMDAPMSTARGAWVSLFGLTHVLVLCVAAALPYPAGEPRAARARSDVLGHVAVGALVGLAWACALRGFMAEVAGDESGVDWVGTFAFVLLPGLVAGGLLGWAAHLRRTGDPRYRRRLALSPFLFAAVLFSDLSDPLAILEDGVGAGAFAVPLIGLLGGYAVCGRGRVVPRALAGLVTLGAMSVGVFTATAVGGPSFALDTPHGLWASVLYLGLLAVLCLGVAVPLHAAVGETAQVERPARRRHPALAPG
ncbi:hypothetical protein [Knoellia sp. p5-6-4]|uniref:hypothetical protein n=1 Tax=unclassified Knoellia TaxID=2618719 RepID=UPI0023DCB4CD|nr:hypothetical protein [Knoellia sp. p5-6-4]MDF2143839.1 hypothetical protein [Knoellia sp. p5-6-4]